MSVSCARVVRILTTLVRISVKREEISLLRSILHTGTDGIPMCPHAHALPCGMAPEREQGVETSGLHIPEVRFMVREYTNREVSRIMGASEEGHYRLIPIVTTQETRCGSASRWAVKNSTR